MRFPIHRVALMAPLLLAVPLASQVPVGQRATVRAQAPGNGSTIIVWPRHLQTLQTRLDSFAVALPAAERALWNDVMLRATRAPAPAAAEVRVTPVLQIGPGGGCEDQPGMNDAANRAAIIVQGGRTAGASGIVVQGGRAATPGEGIVVQGGRTGGGAAPATTRVGGRPGTQDAEVRRPTEAVGPKLEPVPWLASESLGRRLAELSSRLPAEERGLLNWLLTRAAATDAGLPPDGLPSGAQGLDGFWWPPLPKALGIETLSIGPKQDDPRPPTPSTQQRWILRY